MEHIFRFLTDTSVSPITADATGDYSLAARDFYIEASGGDYIITRMLVFVQDTGSFDAAIYGNVGALTNGVQILELFSSGAIKTDLTGGIPVKTNAGWSQHCYDTQILEWGVGDEFLTARWTFIKSGMPIRLSEGERLVARVNDDLTGLNGHTFMVQGFRTAITKGG